MISDSDSSSASVSGLIGRSARLPCDTRPPSDDNPLLLVIWFKEPSTDPIYRSVQITYERMARVKWAPQRMRHAYESENARQVYFYAAAAAHSEIKRACWCIAETFWKFMSTAILCRILAIQLKIPRHLACRIPKFASLQNLSHFFLESLNSPLKGNTQSSTFFFFFSPSNLPERLVERWLKRGVRWKPLLNGYGSSSCQPQKLKPRSVIKKTPPPRLES